MSRLIYFLVSGYFSVATFTIFTHYHTHTFELCFSYRRRSFFLLSFALSPILRYFFAVAQEV